MIDDKQGQAHQYAYRVLLLAIYTAIFFVFRGIIPEKFLGDAETVLDAVEGAISVDGSYAATAAVFSILPQEVNQVLVWLLSVSILSIILSKIITVRAMTLAPLTLVPLMFLVMMAPMKDTIVLFMTLLIYSLAKRINPVSFITTIVLIYNIFAYFVRDYYFVIIAFFGFYLLLARLPVSLRLVLVPAVILLFMFLPTDIYVALEGSRDDVNLIRVLSSPPDHDSRTVFFNPYTPDSAIAFLFNYIYAFFLLNVPFLLGGVTFRELILFANIILFACLAWVSLHSNNNNYRTLALLFLAHITVLIFFEPDMGSYFRHMISVALYLLPAVAWLEEQFVQDTKARTSSRDGVYSRA